MLMKHNNFHFTQIPDQTNNVIFLNGPFLVIFVRWVFCFPGNPALSHTTIYESLTPC